MGRAITHPKDIEPAASEPSFMVIPLRHRSIVWLLEGALAISRGAIHRFVRTEKILRSHSSIVKPILTEENKLHRLEFCLNERANNGIFKEM